MSKKPSSSSSSRSTPQRRQAQSSQQSSSSSRTPATTAVTATTVQPSQLGLTTQEDVVTFQRHQRAVLNEPRSVGSSRQAAAAASAAAAQGRVLVDSSSLGLLANHFDGVMRNIQQRSDLLSQTLQQSVQRQSSRTQSSIQSANAEIARMHTLLGQIDELETEFDKIRHIRDIVAAFRNRVEVLERRIG